ncbi:ABC transporter ATP-binding protein [Candidatus Persebacteraceae bacterium Df01]|jgi:iron(III) transport system ATP-binding protein|uniref:ABC transporter ATP-binding protein n=1 Tax=Candidatus Doriopsillibacter californiensis TaxID=2970740 RepID=A0ABT7QKL9_9GAMM|nr:ABC transporter ATP-binding protein [Candidatus Persebacteraceae bacterium Df01]
MAFLEVNHIDHAYGSKTVGLGGVSLQVEEGQIGCLMGPSGSGKTTVLSCIAGLEPIRAGSIVINSRQLSVADKTTPPEKRRIGMVFQDFALFPHLTVAGNIRFGMTKNGRTDTLNELCELCGLESLCEAYPHELSGGEQQRAALARALAAEPDVLLMDEPFSRLDEVLRERLAKQVRSILKSRRLTTLMVTHSQHEAFLIADVGGVINQGVVCQWDDIYNLYRRPQCAFVAEFVGDGSLLRGVLAADGGVDMEMGHLQGNTDGERIGCFLSAPGDAVQVLLRPDDIRLDESGMSAQVEERAFRGPTTLYALRLQSGGRVLSEWPSHFNFHLGDNVSVRAQVKDLVLFPAA